jgi:hypothetical protein
LTSADIRSPRLTRLAQWLAGLGFYKATDYAFDYVLYPYVIYRFGLVMGAPVMAILSTLTCLLTLYAYDKLGRDWLGIEFAKSQHLYDGSSRFRLALARLLRRSDALAFILLSLRFDPFITTAYLRRGSYNGLSPRDWRIFFGSVAVSNASWSLVCFGGVEALRRLCLW